MHPDLAHLLRYAKMYPDDDTARRVLADWLEENGDVDDRARAEFIRLQLLDEPEAYVRAKTLRLQHLHYWLGAFATVQGVVGGEFHRGLLRLRVGPEILLGGLSDLPRIADWHWVDGLICQASYWPIVIVRHLVNARIFTGLQYLSLQGAEVLPSAVIHLAINTTVGDLRVLDLSECQIDETAAKALVRSSYLAQLREIVLIDARVNQTTESILRDRWGNGICRPG